VFTSNKNALKRGINNVTVTVSLVSTHSSSIWRNFNVSGLRYNTTTCFPEVIGVPGIYNGGCSRGGGRARGMDNVGYPVGCKGKAPVGGLKDPRS